MVVVSHLFLFFIEKLQGQIWLMRVKSAPVWNYPFPDSPFYSSHPSVKRIFTEMFLISSPFSRIRSL